jgi:hypothetical protein
MGDPQDFFEWRGVIERKNAIAEEIGKAKAVLSL